MGELDLGTALMCAVLAPMGVWMGIARLLQMIQAVNH